MPDPNTSAATSSATQSAPPAAISDITSDLATHTLSDKPAPSDHTPTSSSQPLTAQEISTLLTLALLQSLSNLSPAQFPIPASTLYSAHVLPNRPAYIPKEQREDVVVGKSEWKKVSKWFKEVGKEGIVKVKESKGEVMVVSYVSRCV
jgi:translation initiation factor 2D